MGVEPQAARTPAGTAVGPVWPLGRVRVAVSPASATSAFEELLHTLQEAFPVDFVAAAGQGVAGALVFGDPSAPSGGTPTLVLPEPHAAAPDASPVGPVHLTQSALVDPRLRGREIKESHARAVRSLPVEGRAEVLATDRDGAPLWTFDGESRWASAVPVEELQAGDALRDHFVAGRFVALLPLIAFLRHVTRSHAWTPPALRAAFVFDDPNLHASRYGHIRYREMCDHAELHGYHAAMAMIPLDAWYAGRGPSRLYRERADRLSLLVHGNNHVAKELGRDWDPAHREALLAQALRRIAAFERRSGVSVSRVMAAPHGACNEGAAAAMLRLGYEAAIISRPYPWVAKSGGSPFAFPPGGSRLAGWGPAQIVAGGLPILPRQHFHGRADDVFLRAFLDQPMVIFGHHDDVSDGLESLAKAAEKVNSTGAVAWGSMQQIARGSYATIRQGATLHVLALARIQDVAVPDGIDTIRVWLPPGNDGTGERAVRLSGGLTAESEPDSHATFEVGLDDREVQLSLIRRDRLDPAEQRRPRVGPWPIARRIAGELRDRAAQLT